jgi:hypothetical protein
MRHVLLTALARRGVLSFRLVREALEELQGMVYMRVVREK